MTAFGKTLRASPNTTSSNSPKLLRYYPELKGLVPAQSQEELPKLLEKIGANENLLITVPSITADENVTQEKRTSTVTDVPSVFLGYYKYLVRAHLTGEGTRFTEGRTDQQFQPIDPKVPSGYSLIQGFALLPMHFHPFHQQAGHFRYLGRQALNNREYYIVAFAQQPEKAELLGSVIVNGKDITVAYQGVAWIDPDSFQVARMRTDLFKARPEVGAETTETQFSEVRLPVVNKSFWLPTSAVVTRRKKDDALREISEFPTTRFLLK